MYGRNQHNIVIILLLKIIKGKKRKKLGGRKKRNNQPSAFPTKEKCQSPQTTWLSFPREHVSSAVGVQDLEFWLLPSVWEKSLESQEAAQKRITWGFFWPELKVWSERTSQSQLAPLYCCAESPKALGSQVNEPALAFWWWLPPLQWEAEIVDWQQSFFFLVSDHTPPHVGPWFLDQGLNPHSLHWEAESWPTGEVQEPSFFISDWEWGGLGSSPCSATEWLWAGPFSYLGLFSSSKQADCWVTS